MTPRDDAFELAHDLSDKILQGHALWSYFRNKFLLRYARNLQRYLSAADEFAWACFRPLSVAREAAGGGSRTSKVPPLIYLGRDLSPLVFPRDWSLANPIPDVHDTAYHTLIENAPFSTVSLPFYQITHLPETMVLAHEMGHVVEMDLGLSEALDRALENVSEHDLAEDHKKTWQRCRVEAFADVFGATVAGLAFCRALASFLAKDREAITTETIAESSRYAYPTRYLRVLLVLEVLRRDDRSFSDEALAIETEWRTAHGRDHNYKEYESDLEAIVKCFIDTRFDELNKQSIRDLAALKPNGDAEAADWAAKMLASKMKPQANDPRVLLAAAALAFYRDPQGYQDRRVEDLIIDRIEAVADKAPRKAENIAGDAQQTDRQAGIALARVLGSKAAPYES